MNPNAIPDDQFDQQMDKMGEHMDKDPNFMNDMLKNIGNPGKTVGDGFNDEPTGDNVVRNDEF
jgi:hypothetical protein